MKSNFTALFIRRPVLAIVVSLMMLVIGIRAFLSLPVRQYPLTVNAQISVQTTYYGADPDVVAGFITAPLESAISQADGIDYLTSTSASGSSSVIATLRLNYDPNKALSEINTKVNSVLNQLPPGTQQPVLTIRANQGFSPLYIGASSEDLPLNKLTDYLIRVVQPRLQAVTGVQSAAVTGAKNLALRAWLDPGKLAAYGLTAADVSQSLSANNYLSGLGNTRGQMVQMSLNASTSLHSIKEFQDLALKQVNGAVVRLKDVADVHIGADDYESTIMLDGKLGVWVSIDPVPTANMLDVINAVKRLIPEIQAQLPPGVHFEILNDHASFVDAAISEVIWTLFEALAIVAVVIFTFLGSLRAVAIPLLAIPLSLFGTFAVMLAFGFSINLLTLLAFVLSVGIVVDDAIIVVENVSRHLEEGLSPIEAALTAARELGGAIIAMALVLVAVYIPIGFQGGLTGALFTEFAFTLVGAVGMSSVIALVLSPMMCSRLLVSHRALEGWQKAVIDLVDRVANRTTSFYHRLLHRSLGYSKFTIAFAVVVLASIYFLYAFSRSELAPEEDQGNVFGIGLSGAPNATLDQLVAYQNQIYGITRKYPGIFHIFQMTSSVGQSITGLNLQPWDQRSVSSWDIQHRFQKDLVEQVAGLRGPIVQPAPLPGGGSFAPIQFILGSTESFDRMHDVSTNFLDEANKSGMFVFLDTDLKIDRPRATLKIDRDEAAQLGTSMSDVGSSLSSILSGGYVNYFVLDGRSYKVIPQVDQQFRLNPNQLLNFYIRTPTGGSVPLSTIASVSTNVMAESLNHFQQLNAVTVSGVVRPGISLGQALKYLQKLASTTLPPGYTTDFGGQSRQYMQESSSFLTTFVFALVIIFLLLAALFESFRDPVIILVSVPLSLAGALIFINLGVGGATINIYTQVGLVTLMGLISKHGILIVRFANELQIEGLSKRDAIERAAGIRLRPILMTTGAMVFGVIPLLLANGAGAVARFNMGLVIASGLAVGTVFTLFVVPAVYLVLAANRDARTPATLGEPA